MLVWTHTPTEEHTVDQLALIPFTPAEDADQLTIFDALED